MDILGKRQCGVYRAWGFPITPCDDPGPGLSIKFKIRIVGDAPGANGGLDHRCRQTNQTGSVGAFRMKDISDGEIVDDHL